MPPCPAGNGGCGKYGESSGGGLVAGHGGAVAPALYLLSVGCAVQFRPGPGEPRHILKLTVRHPASRFKAGVLTRELMH